MLQACALRRLQGGTLPCLAPRRGWWPAILGATWLWLRQSSPCLHLHVASPQCVHVASGQDSSQCIQHPLQGSITRFNHISRDPAAKESPITACGWTCTLRGASCSFQAEMLAWAAGVLSTIKSVPGERAPAGIHPDWDPKHRRSSGGSVVRGRGAAVGMEA